MSSGRKSALKQTETSDTWLKDEWNSALAQHFTGSNDEKLR